MLPVLAQAARRAPTHAGVGERRRHAVVLEAARRVHPLVLQEEPAGLEADVAGHAVGLLQDGLALADGQNLFGRGERQQFAETPDAAEVERIAALGPLRLEVAERTWRRKPVPVVGHVQQAAAARADKCRVVQRTGGGTIRGNTALKDGIHGQVRTQATDWRRLEIENPPLSSPPWQSASRPVPTSQR